MSPSLHYRMIGEISPGIRFGLKYGVVDPYADHRVNTRAIRPGTSSGFELITSRRSRHPPLASSGYDIIVVDNGHLPGGSCPHLYHCDRHSLRVGKSSVRGRLPGHIHRRTLDHLDENDVYLLWALPWLHVSIQFAELSEFLH